LGVVVIVVVKRSSKQQKNWEIKESDVTLGESIGSGGFGVVFKGIWQGNTVAIKKVVLNSKTTHTELVNDSKNSAFVSKKATSIRSSFLKTATGGKEQVWEEEVNIISKLRHTNVSLFCFFLTYFLK
jgi:serine/threonine protein kinase